MQHSMCEGNLNVCMTRNQSGNNILRFIIEITYRNGVSKTKKKPQNNALCFEFLMKESTSHYKRAVSVFVQIIWQPIANKINTAKNNIAKQMIRCTVISKFKLNEREANCYRRLKYLLFCNNTNQIKIYAIYILWWSYCNMLKFEVSNTYMQTRKYSFQICF